MTKFSHITRHLDKVTRRVLNDSQTRLLKFSSVWAYNPSLQGFTGDCLGCTQQVCEIAFYLGLAVSL